MSDLVLVTGGSGFLASHTIVQLLEAGYRVRATLRSLNREAEVRSMVAQGGVAATGDDLSFAVADLSADHGWREAVDGCRYVLHVASPFPLQQPKNPDDLVAPAREGTLRVLRCAREAGVERVVLTSSWVAVGYGHPAQAQPFDETAWTDVAAPGITPYAKSKTLAERAAWQFLDREGGGLELAVINPGGIFGPALGPDLATSVVLTQQFLNGQVPACPRLYFYPVDVRDVAGLHLRAMTDSAARGQRFLALNDHMTSPLEMAAQIREAFPEASKRVPRREMPDWLVRLLSLAVKDLRPMLPELGTRKYATNEKAKRLLGWTPRSNAECLRSTVESLLRLGVVRP